MKMNTKLFVVLLTALLTLVVVTAKSKGSMKQARVEADEEDDNPMDDENAMDDEDAMDDDNSVDDENAIEDENAIDDGETYDGDIDTEDPPIDPSDGELTVDPEDPRVRAATMQTKIEIIHEKDPRDPMQLAQLVLTQAFLNFSQGANEVSVPSILKELMNSPPRTSMYIVRLLEVLDRDDNFKIDVEEFQGVFTQPVASTALLGSLLFRLQDYDGDGVISRYDLLNDEILSLGVNYNLFDMWRSASQKLAEADLNKDHLLGPAEHANHILFQVNRALVQRRDGTLN